MQHHRFEHGAVSLFIVVFTALLITVVTVSFIRIMVRDQQQATSVDLSQSAYDSAQAGVEDAKRAVLRYQTVCASADAQACIDAKKNLDSDDCNVSLTGISTVVDNEVKIKQANGDVAAFDQAYTCVKVSLQTNNYIGALSQDASKLIPLVGVSAFDTIKVDWFSAKDLQGSTKTVDVPPISEGTMLLVPAVWKAPNSQNRPSVMRAQLMQFGTGNDPTNGFMLSDFDGDPSVNTGGISDASTLFLYPSATPVSSAIFASNVRKSPSSPTAIHCSATLDSGGYACSATITLPAPVGGGTRTAYLNLTSLYKASSYQVTMLSAGQVVDFDTVQPQVDSTGRANDLFRRVQSRIETVPGVYPQAAIDITGNFCKDFAITDKTTDYSNKCTL